MNRLFLASVLLAFTACNNSPSTTETKTNDSSTVKETKKDTASSSGSEWVSLFDGKTTNGWHTYGKSTVGSAWKADSGTLHLAPAKAMSGFQIKDGGDILTNDEYENFDLKLEWKISPKGNSGIMFLVHEDSTKYKFPWNTGPEMQVLDNNGHADGKLVKHRAGDLYDLISSRKETVKPVGEWNQVEIVVNKGKLDLSLNGENVVSTTLWDDNWKKLIAGSKFKTMPDFGTFHTGRIALQDHGNEVWFRNIQIKKL